MKIFVFRDIRLINALVVCKMNNLGKFCHLAECEESSKHTVVKDLSFILG